jgi:hypothetical protein
MLPPSPGASDQHPRRGSSRRVSCEPGPCQALTAIPRTPSLRYRAAWKLSTDPQFIEKVRDVVGPYLDPPEKALVLCVDENRRSRPGTAPPRACQRCARRPRG